MFYLCSVQDFEPGSDLIRTAVCAVFRCRTDLGIDYGN
ncbi:hypothetical protein CDAR_205021, partial [Caerostris darwini]